MLNEFIEIFLLFLINRTYSDLLHSDTKMWKDTLQPKQKILSILSSGALLFSSFFKISKMADWIKFFFGRLHDEKLENTINHPYFLTNLLLAYVIIRVTAAHLHKYQEGDHLKGHKTHISKSYYSKNGHMVACKIQALSKLIYYAQLSV